MSGSGSGGGRQSLTLGDLQEWFVSVGLGVGAEEEEGAVAEQLKDGVLLCQLVNKIKPNSVEVIKQKRSSGDAEENILRFLQACTTLGIKKIFKPGDLVDMKDFSTVLVTLQELYYVAAGMGLGVQFSRHQRLSVPLGSTDASAGSSSRESSQGEEEGDVRQGQSTYRTIYTFQGTNEDELPFEAGELVTVTKVVDGGWWEGICNDRVGWFPGNYVEEVTDASGENAASDKTEGEELYHNLVVKDILDSERTYVQDLHTLLSVYLTPLKSTSILSGRDVELLTGNLAEVIKWQQAFFTSLENSSKLPIQQQNFGAIFSKASKEIEVLYSAYCANHPKAVAVLTDNSDKLSTFMESRGAPSPGMLALTSNLSKPFRRLEKYHGLLKELQRHLTEGHADAENVSTVITTYASISTRTQEIRKRKELEHEMLTSPVQGFSGSCLNELGECKCVVHANVAVGSEEVDERFLLVFTEDFVILAVGRSLSGYEMKAKFPLVSTSVKKGSHTEQWPWAVEILHHQETIHASLTSFKDQNTLIECIGRQEGVPSRRSNSVSSRSLARNSSSLFRAYNQRAMRQASAPIQRQHHWGFRSLRPIAPLNGPQLISLKDRDKSPKSAKKFIYPAVKRRRSSKAIEELHVPGMGRPNPAETRTGDTAILNVVEAYCNTARLKSHIPGERPPMPLPYAQSHGRAPIGIPGVPVSTPTPWALPGGRGQGASPVPLAGHYQGPPSPLGGVATKRNRAVAPLRSSYTQDYLLASPQPLQQVPGQPRKRADTTTKLNGKNTGRDVTTTVVLVEAQVEKLTSDVDDLKQCLQQEIKARVVLENRFQDLLDKLDVNPADQNTS